MLSDPDGEWDRTLVPEGLVHDLFRSVLGASCLSQMTSICMSPLGMQQNARVMHLEKHVWVWNGVWYESLISERNFGTIFTSILDDKRQC